MQSLNSLNSLMPLLHHLLLRQFVTVAAKKLQKKGVFHYKNYNFALGIVTNCKQYSLQKTRN